MKRSIISIFAIYVKKKENYNIRLNEIKYTVLNLDEIRWE